MLPVMSARSVPRLLAVAALATPLALASSAGAAPKFQKCSGTANHGDQQSIKVRVVTCKNGIAFLNKIALLKPDTVKQSGPDTIATLKTNGWTCTLRFKTPSAADPSASAIGRGACSASKKRAIHWIKK